MKIVSKFLGIIIQCVGMVICLPCLMFLAVGGWIVDLGDTLRISGD